MILEEIMSVSTSLLEQKINCNNYLILNNSPLIIKKISELNQEDLLNIGSIFLSGDKNFKISLITSSHCHFFKSLQIAKNYINTYISSHLNTKLSLAEIVLFLDTATVYNLPILETLQNRKNNYFKRNNKDIFDE